MKNESIRWILTVGLAQQALEQACAMQSFIAARKWNLSSPYEGFFYNACIAGLVTSYVRPFTKQNGLRPESKIFREQFSQFPKRQSRIAKTHTQLMMLRHQTYAHFDLEHLQLQFTTGAVSNNPNCLEIILNADSGSHSITQHTFKILPPTQMPGIRRLIEFQLGRITSKLTLCLNRLRKKSGSGVYSFTFKNSPTLNLRP